MCGRRVFRAAGGLPALCPRTLSSDALANLSFETVHRSPLRKPFRDAAPTQTRIYHRFVDVSARSACLKVDGRDGGVGFPTARLQRRMKKAPGGVNLPGAFPCGFKLKARQATSVICLPPSRLCLRRVISCAISQICDIEKGFVKTHSTRAAFSSCVLTSSPQPVMTASGT